ncbi:MAG: hypothetical protein EB025_05005 [Chitinophagaceae bacterium]|nr:hypothetical protein [Chitinophagaceae bacterium]
MSLNLYTKDNTDGSFHCYLEGVPAIQSGFEYTWLLFPDQVREYVIVDAALTTALSFFCPITNRGPTSTMSAKSFFMLILLGRYKYNLIQVNESTSLTNGL